MVLTALERAIDDLRRRVLVAAFLRRLGPWCAALLAGAGSAVLLVRAFAADAPAGLAWLLALALAAPFAALARARRGVPRRSAAVAWLDARAGGSGALLVEHELGDHRWRARAEAALARVVAPAVDGRARAMAVGAWIGPALAFALLCLWVPVPEGDHAGARVLFGPSVERLSERLAALEEELALDDATAAELRARLERLEAAVADGTAESAFEAIDRLEERLASEAERAADAARGALEALARAERDAADVAGAAGAIGATGDGAAALDEALRSIADELDAAGLAAELPSSLDAAGLDPGEAAARASALRAELGARLEASLARLADAGLVDPGELADLDELERLAPEPHVCDASCPRGGT